MIGKMLEAQKKGDVQVELECSHVWVWPTSQNLEVVRKDGFSMHCYICQGERAVTEVRHPLWTQEIDALELLKGMDSRIPVGFYYGKDGKWAQILVATHSGGYEKWPIMFFGFEDVEDYFNFHDWRHSLEDAGIPDAWIEPSHAQLIELETGMHWRDGNGTEHPVIVNAYDFLKQGAATYKVASAQFDELPEKEEVKSRWDCNIPPKVSIV